MGGIVKYLLEKA